MTMSATVFLNKGEYPFHWFNMNVYVCKDKKRNKLKNKECACVISCHNTYRRSTALHQYDVTL